jgi:hypothetical protein
MSDAQRLQKTADKLLDAAAAAEEAYEPIRGINLWPMTPDTLVVHEARRDLFAAKGGLRYAAEVFAEAAEYQARVEARCRPN